MDVGLLTFHLFFLLLFLHEGICDCEAGNTCIKTIDCARRHAGSKFKTILNRCGSERGKVCCPPKKADADLTKHRHFDLLPESCGTLSSVSKITNGKEATPGEYPWMALVSFQKHANGTQQWHCGGSIISKRYILTAAHCLSKSKHVTRYKVRLFEHNLLIPGKECVDDSCIGPPEDFDVEEVIPHQFFDNNTLKNDIALLRVTKDIPDTYDHRQISICTLINVTQLKTTSVLEIAGWGKTEDDEPSEKLLKGIVYIKEIDECNKRICSAGGLYCPLDDSQVCTEGRNGVDVCYGDSGGPLMQTRSAGMVQVGIVSFRSGGCGRQLSTSIYTNVRYYLPWILDNIKT